MKQYVKLMKELRQFRWKIKLLILPIFILMGINRMIILIVPFKYIVTKIGKQGYEPDYGDSEVKYGRARIIGRLINYLSQYTPWESKCYVQALTAKTLLNTFRIPSTIYLGLWNSDEGLKAHAWVKHRELIVTGAETMEKFSTVAYYGS